MKPNNKAQQAPPKKNTLAEIQRLQRERDERRRLMEQAKQERAAEEIRNRENGTPGDVDFQRMIRQYREQASQEQPHISSSDMKICICVRKRPISQKEIKRYDYDSVTCSNPVVVVHDCKLKVDGISKYLENTAFEFDHTFNEDNSTEEIYENVVRPLCKFTLEGGRSTVFAYGQTGSGKTFTMQGIQNFLADDLYYYLSNSPKYSHLDVFVTYFEIYGGRCQDLLNNREKLNIREDGNGEVVVSDLMEMVADSSESFHAIVDLGNRNRTTHATESNDVSSRSHAVCQISLRSKSQGKLIGKLSLIDLAGSERGADTKSHNRQRRMEGAEINKSLLALKECIRALDSGGSHVPYRASKLTLVLKDSFTRMGARTVMICNVSPAASSADHTLNTLRYADRVKERVVGGQAAKNAALNAAAAVAGGGAVGPSGGVNGGAVGGNNNPNFNHNNGSNNNVVRKDSSPSTVAPSKNMNYNSNNNNNNNNHLPPRGPSSMAALGAKGAKEDGRFNHHSSPNNEYDEAYNNYGEDMEDISSFQDDYDREMDELNFAEKQFYEENMSNDDIPDSALVDELHRTVQDLFEEEEAVLNLHMNIIQENAELLTEEGRLLQQIQGDDYDIDAYARRLDEILTRKQELIGILQEKLKAFRQKMVQEEIASQKAAGRVRLF